MRRSLAIALLASAILLAQEHPNFSGIWKLSLEESDFAGKTGPKSKTETIDHKDPSLTEKVEQETANGSQTGTYRYTIDGHLSSNTAMGEQTDSVAKWDGQDLVIHTSAHGKSNGTGFDDRWTLSLDGSMLTVHRHYEDQGIRSDQMLVYHKTQ
jgi:hypothetical protein